MSKFKPTAVCRYANGLLSLLLFTWLFLAISGCQEVKSGIRDGENNSLISNPSASEILQEFADPPVEYSLSFYWGWDGNVTGEVMARDMDTFRDNNVHIVSLEPGYEMGASYLSEGWFRKVDTAVYLAKERDMRLYLVDEGKYPSGFAGGMIASKVPELGMKILLPYDSLITLKGGETISLTLPGEVVSAVAYNLEDNSIITLEIKKGLLNWQAPEGEWNIVMARHVLRSSPTRSVNNPSRGKDPSHALIDYLDASATGKFIEFTHEEYKKYVGDEFGETILGFRGDEPDYSTRGLPWTPALFEEFKKRKGYDLQPYVAGLFIEQLTDELRRVKADYWNVWSALFADNFFKVQADWCAAHNMDYLVHLNHEEDMIKLIRSEGDLFRNLHSVQMPGVDAIWHQIWPGEVNPLFPKYASSAAHVNGHPRSFTESFAAYSPRPDLDQAKWILDQQLVRGINMVEVMFVAASSKGESGMRGWLADERFPDVAKYIHRSCYLLSQGTPAAKLAFLYPLSSIWLGDLSADSTAIDIMQGLLDAQYDFDVIDEQAIESLMTLHKGSFVNKSCQSYSTIIIPPLTALSSKVIDRLADFQSEGGKVISIGNDSILSVDKSFRNSELTPFSWNIEEPSDRLTPLVMEALDESDFVLDRKCEFIKYNHRKLKDADLYFVFNESDKQEELSVKLSGAGKLRALDAMSGQITDVPAEAEEGGYITTNLKLDPWQTRFFLISENLN
jgi:hypothetical protein